MSKKRSQSHPKICVDEHIAPSIAKRFRLFLPTIEAAKHHEFQGRDERDYMSTLYSRNIIFATSDLEFVKDALIDELKHAGIVYIPTKMPTDLKLVFAEAAAGYIDGNSMRSPFLFRNYVIFPSEDGLQVEHARKDGFMAFSWDWLLEGIESTHDL